MKIKQKLAQPEMEQTPQSTSKENLRTIWKAQFGPTYKDSVKACNALSNRFAMVAKNEGAKGRREEMLALSFLVNPSRHKGRAIQNFALVRKHLVKSLMSYKLAKDYASLRRVNAYKAFVYWFQPTYRGFSPLDNALEIYNAAAFALSNEDANTSLQNRTLTECILDCVALFCKLRIIGLLVSNKKIPEVEMEVQKRKTEELIESLEKMDGSKRPLSGLLCIALGFIYMRWKADYERALNFYSKALQKLEKNHDFLGFAALAAWEGGLCIEGLSEKIEDVEVYKLKIAEALGYHSKAAELIGPTTWHLYKGVIHHSISANLSEIASREEDQVKAREYLEQSISEGRKSLAYLSLWSPRESDFLGGSWLASAYQTLASLSRDAGEKSSALVAALNLAKRALKVVSDPNIKLRFSKDNIGDVHFNTSKYYLMLIERKNKTEKFPTREIRKALLHAEKSLYYFRENSVLEKAIRARMLVGQLYIGLLKNQSPAKKTSGTKFLKRLAKKSMSHYQIAANLCKELSWWTTQAECYQRVATVHEILENYREGAKNYDKAVISYEKMEREKPKFAKTLLASKARMIAKVNLQMAKASHFHGDYAKASEHYERAATILRKEGERPLQADFFLGMSLVERAENETNHEALAVSTRKRNDKRVSSLSLLTDAKACFDRVCKSITRKERNEGFQNFFDETKELSKLSRFNSTLCNAKIAVERAKNYSAMGDSNKASSLLRKASDLFGWLADWKTGSKLTDEMKSLSLLCKGLSYFEVVNSPQNFPGSRKGNEQSIYLKSAEVFQESSKISPSKRTKYLALGLGYLSNAFASESEFQQRISNEWGRQGREGRGRFDIEILLRIRERLWKASRCFKEAGESKFCFLASASKDLLDATINIKAGENEIEPVERVNYHRMAYKYMRRAAQKYYEAGVITRYNHVLSVLQSSESEERLIFSVSDVLTDFKDQVMFYSSVKSSLSSAEAESIDPSTETYEEARIEISVEIPNQTIYVGDNIVCEISLLNLGRETVFLDRIDGAVPEGFAFLSVLRQPILKNDGEKTSTLIPTHLIIGQRIILNKFKLDANEGITYKVTLQALQPGNYSWLPSVLYLDENRQQKIAKSKIATLRIEEKEIGINEIRNQTKTMRRILKRLAKTHGTESQEYREVCLEVKELETKVEEATNRIMFEIQSTEKEIQRISSELGAFEEQESQKSFGSHRDSASKETKDQRIRLLGERENLSIKLERLKSKYKDIIS
jgi:tetratricopeptide (TPR) repeat protein